MVKFSSPFLSFSLSAQVEAKHKICGCFVDNKYSSDADGISFPLSTENDVISHVRKCSSNSDNGDACPPTKQRERSYSTAMRFCLFLFFSPPSRRFVQIENDSHASDARSLVLVLVAGALLKVQSYKTLRCRDARRGGP